MFYKISSQFFLLCILSVKVVMSQTGTGITWHGSGALGNGKPSTINGIRNSVIGSQY